MLMSLLKKVFGSRNDRTLKRLEKNVILINQFAAPLKDLNDTSLAAKTTEFKARLEKGESLDAILPEAFAVVREASSRVLNLRHFDVQLLGGMVLHEGNIAEMRTGEGKTLVATLPAYLNALTGKGVHVVTVNDYLAKRDSQWMAPVFEFLGLTVGVIYPDMPPQEKKAAYQRDILYGTNNEFGFDYLRDNMAFSKEDIVQRELNYAIVDEVDSILIDEARTPLIISGAAEDSSALYIKINTLIPKLTRQAKEPAEGEEPTGDYTLDEKQRQAHLTEKGHEHIEALLAEAKILAKGESLYHPSNLMLMHHINAALRAHALFHRDVDYIVKDNQVVIVDEHTGRMMHGRRWSEGLHQAVEAKENVHIQNENQTLASITFQNYFRLYNKLSGMTGTADTEAFEFQQIYNLEVVVIPTNKPLIRVDELDLVYLTKEEKFTAVIEDIKSCIAKNQPVLVGTASIEASELLSSLLNKKKIKHAVLNAKFHEQEAHIIAFAGCPATVTIATNMAGRGTDIVLGGSLESELQALPEGATASDKQKVIAAWQKKHDIVVKAGGLRVIASERHESRRIDNQLRGRSGRQGDPGSSRFYLSLDDHLLRLFASDRMVSMLRKLGMNPGEPIEHKLVHRSIENAQRKLEGYHFDIRKQLLDYDNVANQQRQVIYRERHAFMHTAKTEEMIVSMLTTVIGGLCERCIPLQSLEDNWEVSLLTETLANDFMLEVPLKKWIDKDQNLQPEDIKQKVIAEAIEAYQKKVTKVTRDVMTQFERSILLQTIDLNWREHLSNMDYLRQGIHLRGYAQKDPKQEYKREAFELFSAMLDEFQYEVIRLICTLDITTEEDALALEAQREVSRLQNYQYYHPLETSEVAAAEDQKPYKRNTPKVGRNEPCPCGSGNKYKNCHGKLA
ncbi:MAG: preprotein translocase subunit SecA [Legionellales bacterium RIFCSPHIGHO2_12_FULL_37_14]|nr:MAG: preprotein translocase subunit SecA [Legionellales bacterium RIFCSPHIGHO2_12_FULL_37_14]